LIAPLGFYPRFPSVITHSCGFSKKTWRTNNRYKFYTIWYSFD
jgi:hypothetical protein